ncbi:MAG: type II secretion system protein [Planctomycetota bacterium]|jgi:type II secretory pathway pseudopilin PulG
MIRKRGFTVSEFVLLVALLSILAVVVPSVSGAGEKGRSAVLASYLLGARSRIELYKLDHNGQLPAATGENCANFLRRMATTTNVDGDPGTDCGPYMQMFPANPYNDLATVRVDGVGAGSNIAGWRFDTVTGAFQADDSPQHARF